MFGDASKLTIQLPPLRRRRVIAGLAGGAATFGLAACGAAPPPAAAPASTRAASAAPTVPPSARPVEKMSLRLSWIKNTEFAGFFVAQEKGYYKDEAIDLTINPTAQNLPE